MTGSPRRRERSERRRGGGSSGGVLLGGVAAQRGTDAGQAGGGVALGAVLARGVVLPAVDDVRRVLLSDDPSREVVRISVPLAVRDLLGTGVRGVAQVRRDAADVTAAYVLARLAARSDHRIRLGGQAAVERR